MTCSITATASIVSTLRGMKTRSWGMIIYVILSCCFCWIWLWNWLVFELSVCDGLKLLCFRYLWTHVVITMWTPMYEILVNYLWNGCNMWLVMLNYYDLGCMQVGLKSFKISVDYQVYMGSSLRIWSFRRLFLYLCSYKLVGSVTAGIRARFNIKHVLRLFKTKVFVVKIVFKLIVYISVQKSKFLWYTSDHIPYSPLKDF